MKAVVKLKTSSRPFRAFRNTKYQDNVLDYEYPLVENKGVPTCANFITDGVGNGLCIEDHHNCPGRRKCPYPNYAKDVVLPIKVSYEIPEVYDYFQDFQVPDQYLNLQRKLINQPVVTEALIETQAAEIDSQPTEVIVETTSVEAVVEFINPAKRYKRHGYSHHPLYIKWVNICNSCYDPYHKDYEKIGKDGIKVCEEWHDVEAFIKHFGHYKKGFGMRFKRLNKSEDFKPGNLVLN